jgi:hypothetical protein
MMAGPQAMAQLAAMNAASQGQGQGQGPGQPGQPQGQQGQGQGQTPGQNSQQAQTSTEGPGGSSKGGQPKENVAVKEGPLELGPGAPAGGDSRTASENRDSDAKGKAFADDPWVAKLPPELRDAIRAKAQRRPPRSYEERLRRYFENID